jgi:hypothetical protein
MMPTRRLFTILGTAALIWGCSSENDPVDSPNSTGGHAATGGVSTTGGSATGGILDDSGGVSVGGTPTGGLASGGSPTGGSATGGNATGGVPTGGTGAGATGGVATGGAATGGVTAGGTLTGGATTGGAATGGLLIGGAMTGGDGGNGTGGSQGSVDPAVAKSGESFVALSGLTIVSYGGYLNGESFQQDAIVTHAGYQYTAFWNTNRQVVLARRQLPDGAWEKFDFTDYTNSADDAHNTISLGICPGDGTLHLAFDHHDNDLHYRRSVPDLTTNPESVPWAASSFTSVAASLVDSTPVSALTYPRFVTEPGGSKLLLAARIGQSGSGDELLWEYDSVAQAWTEIGQFIDGVTDSVNAYLHGLAYAEGDQRLHAAWCWRDTPDATTNHDLYYAYSDDHGRTWHNNAGDVIAAAGSSFITPNAPGAGVWSIGQNRGLINQEHLAVDAAGRVHVLLSHLPDSEADDGNFTSARTKAEFFHYWRDTDGTWSRRELGLPVIENFRGSLAIASSNNVYAVLPDLRIAAASAASGYTDWTLLDSTDSGRFFSDPLIDTARLRTEDVLTVYYPEASSPNIVALDFLVQ